MTVHRLVWGIGLTHVHPNNYMTNFFYNHQDYMHVWDAPTVEPRYKDTTERHELS